MGKSNYMSHAFAFQIPQFRYTRSLLWVSLLWVSCLLVSCSDDAILIPEPIEEPKTYVYLVMLNDEPDLKSLTIVDSLNGAGSMVVPDILVHHSNSFEIIIDQVSADKANISASQPDINFLNVVGAGFFTPDSVYVELTIDGATNRDILTGRR